MRAGLPRLARFLGWSAHFATLDAGHEHTRQARLSGVTLPVHGAQVEKLIRECVATFVLREDILQGQREFAETGSFRPAALFLVVFRQFNIREKAAPALRAFFEASEEMIGEYFAEGVEFIRC
jgi:hypothetical protein